MSRADFDKVMHTFTLGKTEELPEKVFKSLSTPMVAGYDINSLVRTAAPDVSLSMVSRFDGTLAIPGNEGHINYFTGRGLKEPLSDVEAYAHGALILASARRARLLALGGDNIGLLDDATISMMPNLRTLRLLVRRPDSVHREATSLQKLIEPPPAGNALWNVAARHLTCSLACLFGVERKRVTKDAPVSDSQEPATEDASAETDAAVDSDPLERLFSSPKMPVARRGSLGASPSLPPSPSPPTPPPACLGLLLQAASASVNTFKRVQQGKDDLKKGLSPDDQKKRRQSYTQIDREQKATTSLANDVDLLESALRTLYVMLVTSLDMRIKVTAAVEGSTKSFTELHMEALRQVVAKRLDADPDAIELDMRQCLRLLIKVSVVLKVGGVVLVSNVGTEQQGSHGQYVGLLGRIAKEEARAGDQPSDRGGDEPGANGPASYCLKFTKELNQWPQNEAHDLLSDTEVCGFYRGSLNEGTANAFLQPSAEDLNNLVLKGIEGTKSWKVRFHNQPEQRREDDVTYTCELLIYGPTEEADVDVSGDGRRRKIEANLKGIIQQALGTDSVDLGAKASFGLELMTTVLVEGYVRPPAPSSTVEGGAIMGGRVGDLVEQYAQLSRYRDRINSGGATQLSSSLDEQDAGTQWVVMNAWANMDFNTALPFSKSTIQLLRQTMCYYSTFGTTVDRPLWHSDFTPVRDKVLSTIHELSQRVNDAVQAEHRDSMSIRMAGLFQKLDAPEAAGESAAQPAPTSEPESDDEEGGGRAKAGKAGKAGAGVAPRKGRAKAAQTLERLLGRDA